MQPFCKTFMVKLGQSTAWRQSSVSEKLHLLGRAESTHRTSQRFMKRFVGSMIQLLVSSTITTESPEEIMLHKA